MQIPETLQRACDRILGGAPVVERSYTHTPGGELRGTLRVRVGDVTAYATRRKDGSVTEKEARVLRGLSAGGGPVPRFLGFEEGWLLAADAGRPRLSERLDAASDDEATDLLTRAIRSLTDLQRVGREQGLADAAVPFARGPSVAAHLTMLPEMIGDLVGVAPPGTDTNAQGALLITAGDAFVKWDARPANATLTADGDVAWFDFQHCNRRWPADDFVWLLCDATVPSSVGPARRLALLAEERAGDDDWAPGTPLDYVATLGTAHVLTRVRGQIEARAGGAETTWEESLREDWSGSAQALSNLFERGAAICALSSLTDPLEPWFGELLDRHRAGHAR
jgi:hypothetical protein